MGQQLDKQSFYEIFKPFCAYFEHNLPGWEDVICKHNPSPLPEWVKTYYKTLSEFDRNTLLSVLLDFERVRQPSKYKMPTANEIRQETKSTENRVYKNKPPAILKAGSFKCQHCKDTGGLSYHAPVELYGGDTALFMGACFYCDNKINAPMVKFDGDNVLRQAGKWTLDSEDPRRRIWQASGEWTLVKGAKRDGFEKKGDSDEKS